MTGASRPEDGGNAAALPDGWRAEPHRTGVRWLYQGGEYRAMIGQFRDGGWWAHAGWEALPYGQVWPTTDEAAAAVVARWSERGREAEV